MRQTDKTTSFKPLKNPGSLSYRFFLFLSVIFSWTSNAQQSYTFTPAGATGSLGPTQVQINTAYGSTNLNNSVTIGTQQGIQQFTIPTTGGYRIEARGGQGYGNFGGRGTSMIGDFTLTGGTVIKILVGQRGILTSVVGSSNQYGGAGGSFITDMSNVPYVVAGGGGSSFGIAFSPVSDANIGTSGNTAINGPTNGAGGTNGSGGGEGGGAGGGGGLLTDATSALGSNPGGKSFLNGGNGGTYLNYGIGAFGGGGGTNSSNYNRGAGGGGYSGGGGGGNSAAGLVEGGGGGSYNNGANQVNTAGANLGDGMVIITKLCNVNVSATNTLICAGTSVTLTTNATGSYAWSNGNTTSSVIVVSPTSNTTYTVGGTGTNPAGCPGSAAIALTVNNTPTVTIASSTLAACLGQSVTLTANGANTYVWTGGSPTVTNGVAFAPSATTTYTVNGTNACGTSSAAVTVTVSALPILVSASSTTICASTAVTLMAGGATNYTWMPGSNTQTNYVTNPAANTVYTVTGKTGSCQGVNTITITTKPNPTITIAASTATICEGGSVVLTASGGITYSWNPVVSSNPAVTVSPTLSTLYTVVGNNAGNCNSSATQVIIVNAKPVMTVTASNPLVCPGDASTLIVSGASTYLWGSVTPGATLVVNPTSTTTYTVEGTSANTCSSATMITVSVFDPTLSLSSSTAVCRGTNVNISASGMDVYQWSTGSGFSSISVTPTITTTYSVNTNSTQGAVTCSVSGAVTVSVNANPTVTAISSPTAICKSESAVITASGAVTYTWAGSTPTESAALTVTPTADQTYTVAGLDANGCKGAGTILVRVFACVGIENNLLNATNLSVYPNPSNGDFTITSDEIIDLKITNELGQQVKTVTLNNGNKEVKVNDLSSGIYFITGKNENGIVKQKIIVVK